MRRESTGAVVFLALLALACIAVYLPALHGPFVFDDAINIVENPNVRMTSLDPASIRRAGRPWATFNKPHGSSRATQ